MNAGQTGKISGKVIDAETNEPLLGANVIINGTTMGGATDINGEYFILNIPPGNYEVKASMIGFTPQVIGNVRVSVDQTTKLNFTLGQESIEMDAIVISAEREFVRKDLTSTETKVNSDDIELLPLENVMAVVNLQAGVINGHFRGGRNNEVKYLIDGISVNDAYSGTSALEAEVNSIEEIQVLTGTFNAEYGEAMSGVVNQVTKIASDKYVGGISIYTGDYISGRDDLYTNITNVTPKNIQNIQADVSGPIPGTRGFMKFFLSGRYFNNDGYLWGQRKFNPSDSSNFSANEADDWHIGATGDDKFIPMNYNKRYSLQGKVSFGIGSGKGIVLNGLYQKREYKNYNHSYFLNPDGDYQNLQESYLLSLSYTHVFSNSAFLDIAASAFNTDFNKYVYENPLDPRYIDPRRKMDVSGASFLTGGTENWHFNHQTDTYTGKLDFTLQADNTNQIKTGIEFNYYNVNYEDFQIVIDANTNFKPGLPNPGAFNYNIYDANPYMFAAYIQDKIELEYLIVNVGARFDYFEPDGEYLKDPNRIAELDGITPPFPDSLMDNASPKYQISPRIGISYPISDKGAVHISYGHFFQVPPFEHLYKNPNFRIPLTGNYPESIGSVIGNTNLEPQQTIMYEIGLQQEVFTNIGLTLTGYYKDIRNLIASEIHIKNEFKKFSKLINQDYGAVQGITLSLEKIFSDGFGGNIDYTFQVAKGNASNPNDAFNKAQASPPIAANKQLVYLDWDRSHSFNFTLTGGVPGNYIISAIGKYGTGLPYTPSLQNERTGLENSDRRPSFFNVDLFITKYFKIGKSNLSLFARVYNLFDTENEINVFSDTGRAGYTLELTRTQVQPRGVNTKEEFYKRPDFYSAPRSVQLGLKLDF